jgi:tetratricopeptide (TPR) repeat protein
MMVWTVEAFGMPKVVEALKLWGKGMRTPDVIKQAFGVDAKDYDAKFRAWSLTRLDRYKGQFSFDAKSQSLDDAKAALQKTPNDPTAHTDLAFAFYRSHDKDAAVKELDAALKLKPDHQPAHYLYARLALGEKDLDAATGHLKAIQKAGGDGFEIEMLLANIAEAKKDKNGARTAFETAWKYDPTQPEPLQGLYDIAKEDKRDADALDILRKLAPIDQHDGKVWRWLLEALVQQQQWAEAVKVGESAIFMAVGDPNAHLAYARALEQQGDSERALYEAESVWTCASVKPKEAAAAHALSAKIFLTQKKMTEARSHRDEALKLDPESADAKALQIP